MSAMDTGRLVRQIYQWIEQNEIDRIREFISPDLVWEMAGTDEVIKGPEGFAEAQRQGRAQFPDMKLRVLNEIASDDAVACELEYSGTHQGTLKTPQGDIPPTGRKIVMRVFNIWEFHNGKVTHLRTYYDTAGMMQQLGQTRKAA
jgi:steroid delta-isomerase-like uncharacterized protein